MRDYRQDFPEESPSRIKKFLYNTKNQKTEIRLGDGQVQTKRYDAENLRCEMRENEKLILMSIIIISRCFKKRNVPAEIG